MCCSARRTVLKPYERQNSFEPLCEHIAGHSAKLVTRHYFACLVFVFSHLAIHCFRVKLSQRILGPLELRPRNGLREQELLWRRLERNHEAPFVCLQLEPHLTKARQAFPEKSRGLQSLDWKQSSRAENRVCNTTTVFTFDYT